MSIEKEKNLENQGNYRFFQNRECEYFPCHAVNEKDDFNCLFCFCPLYALGDRCGGRFSYDNEKGIKDCSGCLLPHKRDSYDHICEKTKLVIEMTRK